MPTLLKRSNGIYYIVSTDQEGRRKWVSTGQRLKSLALKALTEGAPRSRKAPMCSPVEEFFRDFLEYGQNIYSPENLQVYRRAFHGFVRHIGNIRPGGILPLWGVGQLMRLTIRADTIESVLRVGDSSLISFPDWAMYHTVDTLFRYIRYPGTDSIVATYNETFGYPETLDINPSFIHVMEGFSTTLLTFACRSRLLDRHSTPALRGVAWQELSLREPFPGPNMTSR